MLEEELETVASHEAEVHRVLSTQVQIFQRDSQRILVLRFLAREQRLYIVREHIL